MEPKKLLPKTTIENDLEIKKALCIYGGGLRAMSGAAALISTALATEYNLSNQFTSSSTEKESNYYDDALQRLMANFSLVSSNSGGSWFSYAMLLSSKFNDVLRDMTQRYLEEKPRHLFRRNTGKENPFYHSFLAISLKNINKWNEEMFYTNDTTKFQEIQQRFHDQLRKGVPIIGGDLALFLKHSFTEGNIWNSFVEILMSPLTQQPQLPSWYAKVSLDWFVNVTLNLPRLGPLTTKDPIKDGEDSTKNRFRDHGSVLRYICNDNTYVKYVVNSPQIRTSEQNYVGSYQRLHDDLFGRVDLVPAAFKVSSEKSRGLEYNFTSPSLKDLSVQYFIADNNLGDPLSINHIEVTVADPSFDFICQKPFHFNQTPSACKEAEKISTQRNRSKSKFRPWITEASNCTKTISQDLEIGLDEILYRVAASSAAAGGTSDATTDWISDLSSDQAVPRKQVNDKRKAQRRGDLSSLLYLNPISWIRGSLVDVVEDFDVSVLFGSLNTLTKQYENVRCLKPSKKIMEWELRGENLAEDCDRALGAGNLLTYDKSNVKEISTPIQAHPMVGANENPIEPREKITLAQYAELFPLNVSDGGYTDNTGIGRAVMEGATHISCLAFNTDDFLGLFENNNLQTYPLFMHFDVFKCTKDEMILLKKILAGETLPDLKKEQSKNQNFTFVSRETFRQSKGQTRFLKRLFMCKFRDVSVRHNPYYFDLKTTTANTTNKVVKEIAIIFALEQPLFGLMGGCLDANFTHYGIWVEEIQSALQNGFVQEGKVEHKALNLDEKIASALAFRDFMF